MKSKVEINIGNNSELQNINIGNINVVIPEQEKNILKRFITWLLPKKATEKDLPTKKSINLKSSENFEELFKKLLSEENDLGIYDLYLENEKEITSIVSKHYFYLSSINLSTSNYKIPRKILQEAILEFKKFPINKVNSYNIGNAYSGLKLYTESIEWYKKALKSDEIQMKNAEIFKNLGDAYLGLADEEKAVECYKKALKLNPNLFEALIALGIDFIKKEDYGQAVKYFDSISIEELSPKNKYLYYSWLAYMSYGDNNLNKTVSSLKSALSLKQEDNFIFEFGSAVLSQPKLNNLASRFRKEFYEFFLEVKDSNELKMSLAVLYYKDGENEKSKKLFLQLLENNYKEEVSGLIYDRLGHIEEKLGNDNMVEMYFKEASSLNANKFLYCFGFFLQKKGRCLEAIEKLEKCLALYIKDDLIHYNLGICYRNLNNLEKATELLEKALRINPKYELAMFGLVELYYVRKEYEKSYFFLDSFKKTFKSSKYNDGILNLELRLNYFRKILK